MKLLLEIHGHYYKLNHREYTYELLEPQSITVKGKIEKEIGRKKRAIKDFISGIITKNSYFNPYLGGSRKLILEPVDSGERKKVVDHLKESTGVDNVLFKEIGGTTTYKPTNIKVLPKKARPPQRTMQITTKIQKVVQYNQAKPARNLKQSQPR